MITIDVVNSYTANGIIIHPLVPAVPGDRNTGKAPTVGAWQSRTTPYETAFLERELSKGANIGANCGRSSDLTVIDVDYYVKGIWDYVFNGINATKFVTQVRTERDGKKHYLFRHCPDVTTCTNKELGFDIRNDGGNIVLAPSIHCEGDTYRLLAPIESRTVLPSVVALRINEIIGFYKDLKTVFAKCRPCFYKLWKAVFTDEKSEIYHDTTIFRQAEGRLRHLSLFAELKANGASDEVLILACWLIFGEYFDEIQTVKGVRGIDPKKTTKNTTLQADEYYSKFMHGEPEHTQNNGAAETTPQNIEEITLDELSEIKSNGFSVKMPDLCKILGEDHLISKHTKWLSSLSDTYYEYQVGSAFWLISALTEGKVQLRLQQETLKPNIWMFILGRSTTSRKSTAINKTRKIFECATDSTLYNDEFSVEGYLKVLSENPVSNFVRDEVSGLLAKYNKRYNEGIYDNECAIYDGQTLRKALAKEEVIVNNPYVTHLYGTTLDSFVQKVTLENVNTGWGFRFLYFAPEYEKARKDIGIERAEDVEAWTDLLTRVKLTHQIFAEAPSIDFHIDDSALALFNKVVAELETSLDKLGNGMLNAAVGRYQLYALKLAMLIEIGKPQVSFNISEDSMKVALKLVIDYFIPSYMSVIGKLEEDVKFNQVEKVLVTLRRQGNTSTRSKLLKNSKLKKKDFDEVLETLTESGAVKVKKITETGGNIIILVDDQVDLREHLAKSNFTDFTNFTNFTYSPTIKKCGEIGEKSEIISKTDIVNACKMTVSSEMVKQGKLVKQGKNHSCVSLESNSPIQVSAEDALSILDGEEF